MIKVRLNLRNVVAVAICLAVTEFEVIAQNYQIGVTQQGNQYDVNVTQNRYQTIDVSRIQMTSYTPTSTGGIDLNNLSRVGDALTKRYYENQEMYHNAYNQLISLPVDNQCQKDLKDKLLSEFELNVKSSVGRDRWFDANVKKTIMDEVLRINKTIGDNYDKPCIIPDVLKQIQNLSNQSEYREALSLYENKTKDINAYLMTFTSDFGENHKEMIYPLFRNVYDRETAIRRYVENCESNLAYAKQTSSNDVYLSLYFSILYGYDELKDWNKSIWICNDAVNWAKGKTYVHVAATSINLATRHYMNKDKENSLKYFTEARDIVKKNAGKKDEWYKSCEKMIKKLKKNDFSLSLEEIYNMVYGT